MSGNRIFVHSLWSMVFLPGLLTAKPEGAGLFCQVYPDSPACVSGKTECNFCHAGPPVLNPYGQKLREVVSPDTFAEDLQSGLEGLSKHDSDGDGFSNLDEITAGTLPGDRESYIELNNVTFTYQEDLAFKKVKTVYCGASATFGEMKAFGASGNKKQYIHAALDQCLESNYWKNEALHRLADAKIIPVEAVGSMTASVKIAEYDWDYRLYSYIMTGDRDVRDLLAADYHIDSAGNVVTGIIPRSEPPQLGQRIVIAGGQPLQPERRVGMISTQWFFAVNTMFALLPRNAASQAYRAYLGKDIAKGEGLIPIEGEPRDVDNKNIAQPACAVCHSTLDPAAYAFSTYEGIETLRAFLFNVNGTYRARRTIWETDGAVMGQPVGDLLEWASFARESDDFKKKVALDLYQQALSRGPASLTEEKEFETLWQSMPEDGYSANKLIHRLVDTMAFGGRPDL